MFWRNKRKIDFSWLSSILDILRKSLLSLQISRCHLADHVKKVNKSAWSTSGTIIFPLSTNYIIVFWRCCCCCRCLIKHFLIFTAKQHNILSYVTRMSSCGVLVSIAFPWFLCALCWTRKTERVSNLGKQNSKKLAPWFDDYHSTIFFSFFFFFHVDTRIRATQTEKLAQLIEAFLF